MKKINEIDLNELETKTQVKVSMLINGETYKSLAKKIDSKTCSISTSTVKFVVSGFVDQTKKATKVKKYFRDKLGIDLDRR